MVLVIRLSFNIKRSKGNIIMKKEKGFTLAEVLITLGIIGVVAAMTMPTLVNNSRNQECRAGLKTGYSLISNALTAMRADELSTRSGDYASREFTSVFRDYFKLGSKGGNYQDCVDNTIFITTENSQNNPSDYDSDYLTYDRKTNIYTKFLDDGQFILANGMLVAIENKEPPTIYISIDVNGKIKKPNIWGIDLFTFQLMENGQLLPMGADGTDYEDDEVYCDPDGESAINRIACTAKAISDDSYWKNLK